MPEQGQAKASTVAEAFKTADENCASVLRPVRALSKPEVQRAERVVTRDPGRRSLLPGNPLPALPLPLALPLCELEVKAPVLGSRQ